MHVYQMIIKTDMNYLVIGNNIISKKNNVIYYYSNIFQSNCESLGISNFATLFKTSSKSNANI